MARIAELQNRLREQEKQVADYIAAGDEEAAREMSGRVAQTKDDLMEEATLVEEENERLAASAQAGLEALEARTVGAAALGPRDSFTGVGAGWSASVPVRDAVSGLSTPQIYRTDLKEPVYDVIGFLDTIPHGTTNGDEHYFQVPTLDNKAAAWTSGDKAESSMEFTEATAHLETIAHWMPIKRQTANRYGQLESIVSNTLMMGLKLVANAHALRGDNNNGIVGFANQSGIVTHTKSSSAKKNIKDCIMAMRRKALTASGFAPNYVVLSPYALEELAEEKDSEGRYLYEQIANDMRIGGMSIVEDVNMTVSTTTGSGEDAATTVKETAMVYFNAAGSFDVADPEELTIGLKGNQLIQNEYTLLAELTAALRVDYPGAVCYCGDLGIAAEA